jgi:hypothetical protein
MLRRRVVVTLLVLIAVQLAGGMLASVCDEPCPDDAGRQSCPPLCTVCSTCAHAQQAAVQSSGIAAAGLAMTGYDVPPQQVFAPSRRAADIFHVPLPG